MSPADQRSADSPRGSTTEQVRGGASADTDFGARVSTIHLSAGFVFDDFAQARDRFAGDDPGYVCTRSGSSTTAAVERRLVRPEPRGGTAVVEASRHPGDDELRAIALGQSSDLETDLTALDLDRPVDPAIFGEHVSHGSIRGLLGRAGSFADATLRQLLTAKARKGLVTDRTWFVGTAEEFADVVEELGDGGLRGDLFNF